jgi:hypothetical protein
MSATAMFDAIGGPEALTASKLYDLKGQVAIGTSPYSFVLGSSTFRLHTHKSGS